MKNVISIIFLLFTINLQAQTISGLVSDVYGDPLAGVSIIESGTYNGTMTGADGKYTINTTSDKPLLEFECLGMKSQKITANTSTLNIVMEEDLLNMEAIVVVGYGSMRKEEITTSISRVKADEFVQGGVSSPMQLLQGKVAGLGISTTSGEPGSGDISIQLRGLSTLAASSSPLVVIDGIAGGSLNAVSSEDIESIDVLKDGSAAAIYGTRGTNGVIIITTKRPQAGQLHLEYSGYAKVDMMVDNEKYLSAEDFRKYSKEYTQMYDFGASTDWVKAVTHTPISQMHYLSASGGNKNSSYVASLSYDDRKGIYKTSFDESLAAKLAINHSMYDGRLRFMLNLNDRLVNHSSAPGDLYSKAVLRNPTLPIYNKDGSYYENSNDANPVELLNEYSNANKYNQLSLNTKLEFSPIPELKLSATFSYQNDYNMSEGATTHKAYNATMGSEKGSARLGSGHGDDRTLDLQADFNKTFGDHSLAVLAGYSYNRYIYQSSSMYAFNFPIDGFGAWNIGSAQSTLDGLSELKSYKDQRTLIGFYSRINYNYRNRYLAMVSLRYEGSDKFGKNNRWGIFPAISLGWRVSNEDWMKDIVWINDLKIRFGYGVTGTEPLNPYQYIALYDFNQSYMSYVDGQWVSAIVPANNPNDNLKWEEKHEYNLGLDFAFFDSRLSGSIDAYLRRTKDLLYNYTVPVPPNISSNMLANVGSISNRGIELSLNYDIVRSKDFSWTLSANASFNKNRLDKLSNQLYTLEYLTFNNMAHVQTYSHRLEEGWEIGNFYGWKVNGLRSNGTNWRVVGAENSSAGEDQKTILGNGMPKMFAGLSTSLKYKNFDASINLRGAFLFQILNQYRMMYETLAWVSSRNVPKSAFEKVGDYNILAPSTYSDRYIENGDYLKIDNVVLGYTIKDKIRIYLAGRNLFTLTTYKGIDPEAVSITGLIPGIDSYNKYPTLRSFTIGINVKF